MFNFAKLPACATALSLVSFLGTAHAETTTVGSIDVAVALDAPQESNALSLYPDLADDLKQEIMQRIETSSSPTDPALTVDIRKVSLDGDGYLPDSAEFNEMEGIVVFQDGGNNTVVPVRISASSGDLAPAAGIIVLPPSTGDFYLAMLDGFADAVVGIIPGQN